MQKTINLATIFFTLAVTAGVLFHDMHLDKATTVAFALPAVLATYGAAHLVGGSEHIHVERVAFSNQSSVYHSSLPKVTPRDNENRYIQGKKSYTSGDNGDTQLWPSV
ncbi:MAG: hypothetical protein JWN28_848 [Candidatus Saccharibacteria bacterium]|nr:hypothetical protein [Candidatus Saccharibacteria bacterium]